MKKLSMKVKLILFCLFIVVIPISITYYFFTEDIVELLEKSNKKDMENMLQLVTKNLASNIDLVDSISDSIYLDTNFNKKLFKVYDDPGSSVNLYLEEVDTLITKNRGIHQRLIQSISIYTDNDTILKDGEVFKNITAENYMNNGFVNAIEQKGARIWAANLEGSDTTSKPYTLSLYRCLKNPYNELLGILEIKVKEEEFFRMMLEPTDNVMLIVNADGVIVSSNYDEYIGYLLQSIDGLNEVNESNHGSFEHEINGERKIVSFQTFSEDNKDEKQWKIIMLASFDVQDKMFTSFALRGIMISGLCFLGLVVVIILFSESISRRIKRLVKQTERIVKQDYNMPVMDDGEDELGQLADSFNKMQKHLHVLINEVYEHKIKEQSSQLKQKETEFLALQNQINPHFLYNTLDAIRMEAVINKDESTGEMIMSLSALLRYNTSRGNPVVKLQDELGNLTNYISLMNMKYDNSIYFEDSVPDEIYECSIVKFIFQPIAENAFKHGNITTKDNPAIKITGRIVAGTIEIEISDNGIGMDEETLAELNEVLQKGESQTKSIGLRNVNQRIRFNCGEMYGLRIESKKGYGTTVKIILPFVREVENDAEGIIGR